MFANKWAFLIDEGIQYDVKVFALQESKLQMASVGVSVDQIILKSLNLQEPESYKGSVSLLNLEGEKSHTIKFDVDCSKRERKFQKFRLMPI